jgi:hypothetical protein
MSAAISPLPQSAFMAWCSVKAQGQLYLTFTFYPLFTQYSSAVLPGVLPRRRSQSQSYFATDGQSVSQSVSWSVTQSVSQSVSLGVEPLRDIRPAFGCSQTIAFLFVVGRALCREDGSVIGHSHFCVNKCTYILTF